MTLAERLIDSALKGFEVKFKPSFATRAIELQITKRFENEPPPRWFHSVELLPLLDIHGSDLGVDAFLEMKVDMNCEHINRHTQERSAKELPKMEEAED